MNLGQLRAETQTYLMNTSMDENSLSWDETELNEYINEGVFYTQQVTEWFQDFDNIVMTASVSTYTAPPTIYSFLRLTWDRDFLPQTNEYELDRDDPNWRQSQTTQTNNPYRFYFPQQQQNYSVTPYPTPSQSGIVYQASQELGVVIQILETDGVTIDPNYSFSQELGVIIALSDPNHALMQFRPDLLTNPFTTVSGELGELQIYNSDDLNIGMAFVRYPDTLVLDTDTPQLPPQAHYAVVFYALMRCFVREGEFQDIQLAQGWFTAYGDWMESVLENKGRWWATRVRSLEPFEEGSLFAARMNSIGYPLQLDLKPSY